MRISALQETGTNISGVQWEKIENLSLLHLNVDNSKHPNQNG